MKQVQYIVTAGSSTKSFSDVNDAIQFANSKVYMAPAWKARAVETLLSNQPFRYAYGFETAEIFPE